MSSLLQVHPQLVKHESLQSILGARQVLDLGTESFLDLQVLDRESSDFQSFAESASIQQQKPMRISLRVIDIVSNMN
jgi:hypothetical protein